MLLSFAWHNSHTFILSSGLQVRSVPANAADSLYCMQLAQNAVHGASKLMALLGLGVTLPPPALVTNFYTFTLLQSGWIYRF